MKIQKHCIQFWEYLLFQNIENRRLTTGCEILISFSVISLKSATFQPVLTQQDPECYLNGESDHLVEPRASVLRSH